MVTAPYRPTAERLVDEAAESESRDSADILPLYSIVSYGVDFDVAGLVTRVESGGIEIPEFQRGFVWTNRQAARFVESLLVGLPVPGIFLWRDPETEKLLVVDGQQRLRTLQAFYAGVIRQKEFRLPERTSLYQTVHPDFQNKSYKSLGPEYQRKLDNSVIHATVVIQERPTDDDSSIFYLFERLNSEGTPLVPQEIRSAVYGGPLIEMIGAINTIRQWRSIFGPASARMKDQELIMRFLALYAWHSGQPDAIEYASPMKEFLNRFCARQRKASGEKLGMFADTFARTIELVHDAVGPRAFRLGRAFNAAIFDAVMVGVAKRLDIGPVDRPEVIGACYWRLLERQAFRDLVGRTTANPDRVRERLSMAVSAFLDEA